MAEENKDKSVYEGSQAGSGADNNQAVDNHMSQMAGDDTVDMHDTSSTDNHELNPVNDKEKAEIDYGLSAVAKNPKQSMITLVIFVVIVSGLAYYFFFSDSKKTKKVDPTLIDAQKVVDSNPDDIPVPTIPNSAPAPAAPSNVMPEPKKDEPQTQQQESRPPAPAPAAAPQAALPNISHAEFEERMRLKQEAEKRKQQRDKANIMVQNGGAKSDSSKNAQDIMAANGEFTPGKTGTTQTQITKMGNLQNIIAQGKIMDAVLESSIISSYPGPVRALVTTDVYSEKGDNVLIQKGSRLIGTFSSGFSAGQNRVAISWNRVIMPNGFDIAVNSPTISPEGIVGAEGKVHTELAQTLTNALLVSAINIAFAKGAQELTNTKSQTQTTTSNSATGNTTTTSVNDPTRDAITQSTQNFNQSLQQFVQQNFVVKPFISIPHGTRLKVFVNKDLLFPKNLANGINMVQ